MLNYLTYILLTCFFADNIVKYESLKDNNFFIYIREENKMNRKLYVRERLVVDILKAALVFAISFGMYYVWTRYYNPYIPKPFFEMGNYFIAVVFAGIYIFLAQTYGAFQIGTSTVPDLIYSQGICISLCLVLAYVIFSLMSYALVNVVPFIIMFAVFFSFAIIWTIVTDWVHFKVHPPKKTIFVYDNMNSYYSLKGIKHMDRRFNVVETLRSRDNDLETIYKKILSVDAIFLCGVPSDYRNEIVKFCVKHNKVAYIKPKISDTIIRGGKTIQLLNVPVYRCSRNNPKLFYTVIKRAFDIIVSGVAIVILSPIMLVVAIAIKAYDKGPVIYKQERLTLNGKRFMIWKFRSMKVDAENDGVARLASEDDDRITPVGHFIRKLRIDEIPQLFNILGGSMSIVGPRPERPEIAEQYENNMPEFALRLQVKAGLTGYAQVYGKYNTPPYDKVQMDLTYVATQSLLVDIKLILMTVKILFMKESTEGVSEDQLTADMEIDESNFAE